MRTLVAIALAAAVALPLGACGAPSSTGQPEREETQQETAQQEAQPTETPEQSQSTTTADDDVWAILAKVSQGVEQTQLSGDGDDVIDLPQPGVPVLLNINCDAGGYFGVKALDSAGKQVALFVNEAGSYHGTVTTWENYQSITTLQIEADGPWTIDVLPMDQMPKMTNGQVLTGDSVVYVDAPGISKITLDCPSDGYFGVKAFGMHSSQLLANEVAPYSGTKAWNEPQFMLVVQASGDWSASW